MILSASLLILALAGNAPAESWIEVKTPAGRVTVVTDAGERAGRRVAFQLAQFDRSLQNRFPSIKLEDETPLIVFASADEGTVRSMAPDSADPEKGSALSSYLVMATQHVGAVRAGLPDPSDLERSPFRAFYRGRASYLIERSFGKSAPSWLSRGLVTFLSDPLVKDKETLVGRVVVDDEAIPLPAPAATEFFREGRGADRRFDRQAALFVHYLLMADGGRNAPAFDALLQTLAAREEAASVPPALTRVSSLYAGFPKHLASKKFSPMKLPTDPSLGPAGFLARPLPPAEALMLRAEILFDLNRPVDTRGLLRQAKAADPTLARPLEIEAILFEREQRSAESKQAIEAAIQLGSKNASLHYRLAQLQWSRTMTRPALLSVQKLLETARDLATGDPSVLAYLAEIQGDLGLTEPALGHAQRGAVAAPADVYAQMALARAQWNARQTAAAQETAAQALTLAKVASQKQRVQEFLTFATTNKRAQAAGTKPYRAQSGPPPAGGFGATRAVDASALTDCFANRNDAACARAVPGLEVACAEKQATSCVSLGSLYDGGFGVTRDRRKAAAAYKTACDLSDKPGCARLAVLEEQGAGVPRNATRATRTLEALCREKVPEACIGLAQILERTGYATDRARAHSLLKSTCEGGAAEACALLPSR